jgi:hypothetical protein
LHIPVQAPTRGETPNNVSGDVMGRMALVMALFIIGGIVGKYSETVFHGYRNTQNNAYIFKIINNIEPAAAGRW